MADAWNFLDDRTEQELHKYRLLNVEERPFKRITKRLQQLATTLAVPPTPNDVLQQKRIVDFLRKDIINDFSIFDASLSRIQFLLNANEQERARYECDKQRILDECQNVREQNAALREDLEKARETLRKRKRFDNLADEITSNRLLRPREDQRALLKKLEYECAELERERDTYAVTWKERKEQFNRIMNEGMELRRQIRDEAEEVDRRQGMNDDEEETAETPGHTASTPMPPASRGSTPRLDGKEEFDIEGLGREARHRLGSNLRTEIERSRSRSVAGTSPVCGESAKLEPESEEEGEEEGEEIDEEGEAQSSEDEKSDKEVDVDMNRPPSRKRRNHGRRYRR